MSLAFAGVSMLVAALLSSAASAGVLYGINHTHWAINRFSVNGQPAMDGVDPYQRGGGGWGYSAPLRWKPGMTVRVEWETGVAFSDDFPGFADEEKYLAWRDKGRAQKRQHSKQVSIPDYTGQKTCGLTVHFLPCDDLQVTTSCYAYGQPEYPITIALQLPVPATCPLAP